jgi:hypothetical protein
VATGRRWGCQLRPSHGTAAGPFVPMQRLRGIPPSIIRECPAVRRSPCNPGSRNHAPLEAHPRLQGGESRGVGCIVATDGWDSDEIPFGRCPHTAGSWAGVTVSSAGVTASPPEACPLMHQKQASSCNKVLSSLRVFVIYFTYANVQQKDMCFYFGPEGLKHAKPQNKNTYFCLTCMCAPISDPTGWQLHLKRQGWEYRTGSAWNTEMEGASCPFLPNPMWRQSFRILCH